MTDPRRYLKVFLCHSSHDKQIVRDINWRLLSKGIIPWLDEESLLPGQNWHLEIKKAVRNADVVIVCLSKESINKAGFVQKEIKYAIDVAEEQPEGEIFLIPLRLEECIVPERLRKWQWVDFFEEKGYERLLKALHYRANSLGIPFVSNDLLREDRPCSLIEAISKARELFSATLILRGIKLEVIADVSLLIDVMIDVPLYVIILSLTNLIDNAKKASKEGSTIQIKVEVEGQWILCHVSDSGHGIPEEVQDKIFDLGFKINSEHSGWGLYLVAHTLKLNNADIFLSSSSSSGTRFTLRLPKYQSASRAVNGAAFIENLRES